MSFSQGILFLNPTDCFSGYVEISWHPASDLTLPLSQIVAIACLLVYAPNWITKVVSQGTCSPILYCVSGHITVQDPECYMNVSIYIHKSLNVMDIGRVSPQTPKWQVENFMDTKMI